jgi:glycosyltransferase involved in cell wall biosynthesis
VPVWLFATSEPAPETVALCKLVLVRSAGWTLALDAYRLLWPYWVALSVAPWTGGHGRFALKLVPFFIPPFRVLLQNKHGDFLAGTPAGILRHLAGVLHDALDNGWNHLRTVAHAIGNQCRDAGHWLGGLALNVWLVLLLAIGILLRWLGYPQCRLFHRLHGDERLVLDTETQAGMPVLLADIAVFHSAGIRWDGEKLEKLARTSEAPWILWQEDPATEDTVSDFLPLFEDSLTFAVSRQRHFRAWKHWMLPTAPFRTLQPGEFARVLAPVSATILVDRRKLLALGIPRTALAGTAWMLLFWKAAAVGWQSFSAGQEQPLREQPDFPMQETGFLARLLLDPPLRRLGPQEPELARGCIAFARRPAPLRSERLQILLVTPFLPYPLSHGGAVRIFNLCRALSSRADFSLIAIREKHDHVDYGKLHEIFREVHVVDIDERASGDERLPAQVRGHRSQALRVLIADLARRSRPDILQLEYTHMASFRDAAPEIPALLVEHDVTFSLYRQLAEQNATAAAKAEYQRWLDFERRWLKLYEGVWTVSDEDRELVLREAGREPGATFTIPNGVDVHRFSPGDAHTDHPEIFYVGSFRHLPNILGFRKLYAEVMPRIWKRFPDTRLRVVAGPRHENYLTERLPPDSRVEIHGFVEDLRPLYERAAVVAVPLEVSAGTNIKVLEAMACGKAVVSTPIGCAGLGLRDGVDALVRADWSGFAGAICILLEDAGLRRTLAQEARRTAEARFSWTAIADRAFENYRLLARPGRGTPEDSA